MRRLKAQYLQGFQPIDIQGKSGPSGLRLYILPYIASPIYGYAFLPNQAVGHHVQERESA
jgi:hypothetical protein